MPVILLPLIFLFLAQEGENSFALDLLAFNQRDGGGDPNKTEAFDYLATRAALRYKFNETYAGRANWTVALIDNEDADPLASTIANASTTSASPTITTSDSAIIIDITPEGSPWKYSPGVFYHHQIDFIGTGIDFGLSRELLDGNAEISGQYSLRVDFLELNYWDRTDRGPDERYTNNFFFNYTQYLSPEWKGNLGFQYTRMDGHLSDKFNYVTLYNGAGIPVLLVDERLPEDRDRFQVNGRLRYSPSLGTSLGLDSSFYWDSWDIKHGAVEPSFDISLGAEVRLRAWYRYSFQRQTRYFTERPTAQSNFQTQDSDLGTFNMQSPGGTLTVPWGENRELRLSVYGFSRNDGIDGIGAKMGVVFYW